MEWQVEGADASTGKAVRWRVKADTEAQAVLVARQQGAFVSAITPVASPAPVAPPDHYAPAVDLLESAAIGAKSNRSSPRYDEIVTGAKLMRFLGNCLIMLGLAAFTCSIVMVGMVATEKPTREFVAAEARAQLMVVLIVAGLAYGLALIVAGIFLKMNASLALAVRDVARNSFRI